MTRPVRTSPLQLDALRRLVDLAKSGDLFHDYDESVEVVASADAELLVLEHR